LGRLSSDIVVVVERNEAGIPIMVNISLCICIWTVVTGIPCGIQYSGRIFLLYSVQYYVGIISASRKILGIL
jgi:hypothetical protein